MNDFTSHFLTSRRRLKKKLQIGQLYIANGGQLYIANGGQLTLPPISLQVVVVVAQKKEVTNHPHLGEFH